MKKVVIAIDSFKGSLSSREVADDFALGLHSVCPDCEVVKVGIADGGEGTIEVLVEALGGDYVEVEVCVTVASRRLRLLASGCSLAALLASQKRLRRFCLLPFRALPNDRETKKQTAIAVCFFV